MENATNNYDHHGWDLDEWLEISNTTEDEIKPHRRAKKRRRPLRKNRKPSRPMSYIGQRSNNHLLKIFTAKETSTPEPKQQ